jgi:ribosomal protein S18 acetylase RimI-like enzyme
MNKTNGYVIRALSPDLLDDYLTFFDHIAFADNPKWASCYCYFPHAPHDNEKWHDRTGVQNRAAVIEAIREGRIHGYLAFENNKPVAWCNAGPRASLKIVDDDPAAERIGSIVCFVVAKPFRGKGIARRLLEAACGGFQRQGIEIAEAYPRPDAHDDATSHYGPLKMFLAAGFEPFKEDNGSLIVRKRLE